jgi:DNA-binding response OmpR family regulator
LDGAFEKMPDLIISDIMMPGMDGMELCRRLKTDERTSHIPIILLTARAGEASKLEGLETGADDYLTKPFHAEELTVRVKNLIEQRAKLRECFSKKISVQPKDIAVTSTDEKFLQRALQIMEDKIGDPEFDVETFSKEMGMSRTQLHRKLKALTDQSPSDFMRIIRLKRAATLLEGQVGNISEVAFLVGFNSLTYFTRTFKQYFGKTPSDYIHSHSKNMEKK